jgi:hypothetical protein
LERPNCGLVIGTYIVSSSVKHVVDSV